MKGMISDRLHELDGEDVIEGFMLKVKRLFELPNIGQPDDFN